MTRPSNTVTAGGWSKRGHIEQMKEMFEGFEPRICEILEMVRKEDLLVWKLVQLPILKSWAAPNGRVVLVADGEFCVLGERA